MEHQPELPRYKSHKMVRAVPISSAELQPDGSAILSSASWPYGHIETGRGFGDRFKPDTSADLGYYVRYTDGYESWSPTTAFEEGYTLMKPTDQEQGVGGIHPAPIEFSAEQLAADPILRFFHYQHLPPNLQERSEPFCRLALDIVSTLPRNPERSTALRKLLEGKDAAVRAAVPA